MALFCFIRKGVRAPMELSTYFESNAANTGQFERTLIIAEEGSSVKFTWKAALRRCVMNTSCMQPWVELIAMDNAQIKYSTVQNWYPGDEKGRGGIYNFVTKRGMCKGGTRRFRGPRWKRDQQLRGSTQLHLARDNSIGEFYSVAVTNNYQQADTGTKMVHVGKNTKSTIVSKGISGWARPE